MTQAVVHTTNAHKIDMTGQYVKNCQLDTEMLGSISKEPQFFFSIGLANRS